MRQRKPANIAGSLQQYAAHIVSEPFDFAGSWKSRVFPPAKELHVDLGCGKGFWLAQTASSHADTCYIGIDNNDVCIARSAAKLHEANAVNATTCLLDADLLHRAFAPGEIDYLHLNFNSPFPPKKYAWKRLSHLDRLLTYRTLLGEDGTLELRTDHDPYWAFSLIQLELAGYTIIQRTDDLHAHPLDFDVFESEYHRMTASKGAVVHALKAIPGPSPATQPRQTAPLGLVDYLPEDLSTLERIPYGMEGTVENLRNRAANAQRRLRNS